MTFLSKGMNQYAGSLPNSSSIPACYVGFSVLSFAVAALLKDALMPHGRWVRPWCSPPGAFTMGITLEVSTMCRGVVGGSGTGKTSLMPWLTGTACFIPPSWLKAGGTVNWTSFFILTFS
jgi:hypothetical protein